MKTCSIQIALFSGFRSLWRGKREREEAEKAAVGLNHPSIQTEGDRYLLCCTLLSLLQKRRKIAHSYLLKLFCMVQESREYISGISSRICERKLFVEGGLSSNLIDCFQWLAIFNCPLRFLPIST